MLLNSQQNQLLVKIKEILDKSDTIVFVGSGISRWSGLPSWYSMIEELADFLDTQGESSEIVRKELKTNDLLQAASYGIDLLTKPQIAEFFRLACRAETAVPHEIHKEIISLGPSCFVTTNYDQLLEHSFSKWHTDKNPRVVTNNQLTETANIIQARSSNFIFKPHGDINDSESIVLTREHYRKLSGEKQSVLRALETLLASRPIVFLGFGLRDLDFLYVKDTLANTYKGGTIDHYAIMPDVSEQERTYWKKNYGIHILSYATSPEDYGHRQLLDILQQLNNSFTESSAKIDTNKDLNTGFTSEKILAVARYSANIVHSFGIQNNTHIPLRISFRGKENSTDPFENLNIFDHSDVETFLEKYQQNAILIGNPGAGKSYSLRRTLFQIAQKVQSACLHKKFDVENIDFPVYIDLKLYDGDIFEMINQILPPEFSIQDLAYFKKVLFFFDSYNELPDKYSDNSKFKDDLTKLLTTLENSSTIITSRFSEGLTNLNYPVYQIENIDYEFIEKKLAESNSQIPNIFRREIINLLQKPLFFRLYQDQKISLFPEMIPVDIYKSFIKNVVFELKKDLGIDIPLEKIFQSLAYDLINRGTETFTLSEIEEILSDPQLSKADKAINTISLTNWLISENFIIPSSKSRLSFFHQSITEYFASLELAERYKDNSDVLNSILKYTRWDQCLYLTLGFLNKKNTIKFIQKIIKTDLLLAVKATKYLEYNFDEILLQILKMIQKMRHIDYSLSHHLAELPANKTHKEILLQILNKKGNMGGTAAKLLQRIYDEDIKNILIKAMFENPLDFNFGSNLGEALSEIIEFQEFKLLFEKIKDINIDETEWEDGSGLAQGMENIAKSFRHDDIFEYFQDWTKFDELQKNIIARIVYTEADDRSLSLLTEMVISGEKVAIFPFYIHLKFTSSEYSLNWATIPTSIIHSLINKLEVDRVGEWALECMFVILKERKDLLDYAKGLSAELRGMKKVAILYCDPRSLEDFWLEVSRISDLSLQEINHEPVFLFQAMEVNWKDKEDIFIKLLNIGNYDLDKALLEALYAISDGFFDFNSQPVHWWLEWMINIPSNGKYKDNWWILNRLGNLLGSKINAQNQSLILDEFNKAESKYREIITEYILGNIPNLTLEALTEESIMFLLEDLKSKQSHGRFNIGTIATERFVEEKLMPLVTSSKGKIQKNILNAINLAETRNKRRFI